MSRKEKRCITSAVAESAKKNEKRLENCGKKSQLKSIYQVKNRVAKTVAFTQTGLVHKAQTLSSIFGVLNTDSRCEWRANCNCSFLLYKNKHHMTVIRGWEALLASTNELCVSHVVKFTKEYSGQWVDGSVRIGKTHCAVNLGQLMVEFLEMCLVISVGLHCQCIQEGPIIYIQFRS